MGQYDGIFSDEDKVALSHDGEIFKFNDWTVGCKFVGVYIGNHIWQGEDGPVVAHDFAKCEIDGKDMDPNQVYTINEFAQLKKLAESMTPGQIVQMVYNGRSTDIKGKPHNVSPSINPNIRDENWRSYAGAPIETVMGVKQNGSELSPPLESGEEKVEVAEAPKKEKKEESDDVPFKTVSELKKEITTLVGTKYSLKEKAEIKVKVIEDAELPFNDDQDNLEAILAKLTEKYAA